MTKSRWSCATPNSWFPTTIIHARGLPGSGRVMAIALHPYLIGVPHGGHFREILNSDAEIYGGSNQGNLGGVTAENVPCHNQQQSAEFCLPPMSAIVFQPA